MALPSVEKTWESVLNHRFGYADDSTDHRQALFHLVTTLLGFTNNPWTLVASSDSLTAGYPGPGWTEIGDLVGVISGAHSWIVLEKGDGEGQLLIDLDTSSSLSYIYRCAYFGWDPKGAWTGGTTTAKPTSATGQTMASGTGNSSFWITHDTASGAGYVCHIRHSIDGKHDYIFWCRNGLCQSAMFFTTPEDAPAAWTYKGMGAMHANTTTLTTEFATMSYFYSTQLFRGVNNSDVSFQGSIVLPGYDGSTVLSAIDTPGFFDPTAAYPMAALELATTQAAGYGMLGRLPDIWAGSTRRLTGDTYPADNSHAFAQFGDFIVPWDGSIPLTW